MLNIANSILAGLVVVGLILAQQNGAAEDLEPKTFKLGQPPVKIVPVAPQKTEIAASAPVQTPPAAAGSGCPVQLKAMNLCAQWQPAR